MSSLSVAKVTQLPDVLEPSMMYIVKSGNSLLFYVTDAVGHLAYTLNNTQTVTVQYPQTVYVNQSIDLIITNFDSSLEYTITSNNGTTTHRGDTITFTAGPNGGLGSVTVNGRTYFISILGAGVLRPTLTTTVTDNVSSSITPSLSTFQTVGVVDTHLSTDWQVSLVSDFSSIFYESLNDTVNLNTLVISGLDPNTTYYLRGRHQGQSLGMSAWSLPVIITTKTQFIPKDEYGILTAPDSSGQDLFGYSFSVSDDGLTIVIGAPYKDSAYYTSNTGRVYVFQYIDEYWTNTAILNTDLVKNDNLTGYRVALSGDGGTLAVTSIYRTSSNNSGSGQLTLYRFINDKWTVEAVSLYASDYANGSLFGSDIVLNYTGDLMAVGCVYNNSGYSKQGSVYLFKRTNGIWSEIKKITEPNPSSNSNFGKVLSFDRVGDLLAVGSNQQCVYIYNNDNGNWTLTNAIEPTEEHTNFKFADSLQLSRDGQYLAVGAPNADNPNGVNTGKVYIFRRDGLNWIEEFSFIGIECVGGDKFGSSVALNDTGDSILVGAEAMTTNGVYQSGTSFIYSRSGSYWSFEHQLKPSESEYGAVFGDSVYLADNGGLAVVGAYNRSISGIYRAGAVYLYK